jgi:tetratricopeptide (TPR) repeat protein
MGLAYTELDKFKEAIEAYKKAIEINPDYGTAYYNMGIAYTKPHFYQAQSQWLFFRLQLPL